MKTWIYNIIILFLSFLLLFSVGTIVILAWAEDPIAGAGLTMGFCFVGIGMAKVIKGGM